MNYFLMSVLLFSGTLSDRKFSMPNFIFIAKIHCFFFFCRKSGKWVKNLGNNYASQVFHLEYLPQTKKYFSMKNGDDGSVLVSSVFASVAPFVTSFSSSSLYRDSDCQSESVVV